MPFIDDDLLWCPDNDGKMVDLSCLVRKFEFSNVTGVDLSSNQQNFTSL